LRVNERIRVPQVRVIDQDNQQVGVLSTPDALNMAREAGMDLVEVAPNSDPPVCRLMDFGKWKYDQKKREHRAKVKQHNIVLKELRLRPKTDTHDKEFKLKKAREFLEKGSKVQFTMLFRGREMAHLDRALETFQDIADQLHEIAKVEMAAKRLGRKMTMVLAPGVGKPRESQPTQEVQPAQEALPIQEALKAKEKLENEKTVETEQIEEKEDSSNAETENT